MSLYSDWEDHSDVLGLLELVSIQSHYLVILEKSLFHFPQCTVTLEKGWEKDYKFLAV